MWIPLFPKGELRFDAVFISEDLLNKKFFCYGISYIAIIELLLRRTLVRSQFFQLFLFLTEMTDLLRKLICEIKLLIHSLNFSGCFLL
jgi:hypothetical protein